MIKEEKYKDFTIKIVEDNNSESPREYDNLGVMATWHRRYKLGDSNNFSNPKDFCKEITYKNAIIIPLYLYDHSGITISTTSFNDSWDSGQIGYIYATYEDIKKEFNTKKITKKVRDKVIGILESEVKTYDQYLTGEVYGYEIIDKGESIDSCYGFYGLDYVLQTAKETWDYLIKDKYPLLALIPGEL